MKVRIDASTPCSYEAHGWSFGLTKCFCCERSGDDSEQLWTTPVRLVQVIDARLKDVEVQLRGEMNGNSNMKLLSAPAEGEMQPCEAGKCQPHLA